MAQLKARWGTVTLITPDYPHLAHYYRFAGMGAEETWVVVSSDSKNTWLERIDG